MLPRSPGTPRRTTSADDQDDLRIRSYYNKGLKIFPKIQNIALLTDLDLSHNNFVDFTGMTKMPSLTRLNISNTSIQTFVGAVEQESLIQISAQKTPLSSHSFFNLMCLIVFGTQIQLINQCKITSADVKQCKRYKEFLLPYLLQGWVIMNLIPNVVIYEVKTQKRRRIFLKLPQEEKPIPKSARKTTKHVPLRSPMSMRKKGICRNENENAYQNQNNEMPRSMEIGVSKSKHSATPDVRRIKDIEANAALEHQQQKNAKSKQQNTPIIETPSREQSSECFELKHLVQSPIVPLVCRTPAIQSINQTPKSSMKQDAIGRSPSTVRSRIPVRHSSATPTLKKEKSTKTCKSSKENIDTSNLVMTPTIKTTPRKSSRQCYMETPNAKRLNDSPSATTQQSENIESPKANTDIEHILSPVAKANIDKPKKAPQKSILKKSKSPLRIDTTAEFSTIFNAPLEKVESPLRVQENSDVNIEILPQPVPALLKIERSPSVTKYIPSSPLCSPPSSPPNLLLRNPSPMSSSSPLPSPDEFESKQSCIQWPERRTPKRVIIRFDTVDDKSDSSFDVTDLGLPLFAND